jgi:hypothetical protein
MPIFSQILQTGFSHAPGAMSFSLLHHFCTRGMHSHLNIINLPALRILILIPQEENVQPASCIGEYLLKRQWDWDWD